jgi:hypothetical protein
MSVSAAAAVLSWKDKKFWILWKIDLPWKDRLGQLRGPCLKRERNSLTLLNSRQYRAEIVIHEDSIGSFFRNVRTTFPHRHTNVSHF